MNWHWCVSWMTPIYSVWTGTFICSGNRTWFHCLYIVGWWRVTWTLNGCIYWHIRFHLTSWLRTLEDDWKNSSREGEEAERKNRRRCYVLGLVYYWFLIWYSVLYFSPMQGGRSACLQVHWGFYPTFAHSTLVAEVVEEDQSVQWQRSFFTVKRS